MNYFARMAQETFLYLRRLVGGLENAEPGVHNFCILCNLYLPNYLFGGQSCTEVYPAVKIA